MKTKLEACLILCNMAQAEPDEARREALLVGIHHTIRRKLHDDRYRNSRTARGLPVWSPAPSSPVPPAAPVQPVPTAAEA